MFLFFICIWNLLGDFKVLLEVPYLFVHIVYLTFSK